METEPDARPIEPLLLTPAQAASLLGIGLTTLYKMHGLREIPAPVEIRGRKRWSRQELADWIAAGCPRRNVWERTYRP